ncbi:hypothetical protein F5Y03DRAFT_392842 [Xylaria venustula]|nr:hypothetical protein F5Y03DRAFT_392842 [Xylaria venustula]
MSVFATLEPNNVLAKLAFDEVSSLFINQRQGTQAKAYSRMHINPLLDFERNSLRKQLEPRTTTDADVNDAETVVTVDELDSETEKNNEELRRIYTGHYFLSLDSAPDNPKRGYTVGKGILGNEFDLILCTKDFATKYDIKLRNPHALFSFYKENRGFYIASGSKSLSTQLTLNGHPVQQHRHALNQHSMNICFDRLEYTFKWTDHAKEYIFMQNRSQYVTDHLGGPPEVDVEMPTPLANTRTIGRWTLGQALGAGTYGRVFCAISSQGQIAAIKILDRTPDDYAVKNAEVRRCQELSEYAKEADTGGRLLRVIEVIADDHERPHYQPAFDQIAVVMEPIARETFHDLCDRGQAYPYSHRTAGEKRLTV